MNNGSIFQDKRMKVFLAVFVMIGWSLAYPLIKLGYQEFQIDGTDLGGKILFAGVRFFMAGTAVTLYCHFKKVKSDITNSGDIAWLVLLGIVNTALHYMFAYIGLGYNSSARSTILDSMGGFILILLSTLIFLIPIVVVFIKIVSSMIFTEEASQMTTTSVPGRFFFI